MLRLSPRSPAAAPPPTQASRLQRWAWLLLVALGVGLTTGSVALALYQASSHTPASVADRHPTGLPGAMPAVVHAAPGVFGAAVVCSAGSRVVVSENVTVDPDEWICGDLTVFKGNAIILGRVDGNVQVIGGTVTVSGRVDGNVTAIGGDISLLAGTRVSGSVDAFGGEIHREGNTAVGNLPARESVVQEFAPTRWLGFTGPRVFPWASVLLWILAGAVSVTFFPEHLGRIRSVVRRGVLPSMLAGVAALALGAVAAVLLAITCLGIPIALLVLAALWLAWVLGTVAVGMWFGERLLRAAAPGTHSPLVATLLGVTLIAMFESIPCVGGVIALVIGTAGLGATALVVLNTRAIRRWHPHAIR